MNEANPLNLSWIPCGIELTYVHPGESKNNMEKINLGKGQKTTYDHLTYDVREFHEEVWEGPGGCIMSDPGCVEWSTQVLHSWKEAKAVWEYGHTLAEMFGLREEVEHLGGGMGHIHVRCDDPELAAAIMVDLYTRPYVAWAFAHPSAIEYCSPSYMHSSNTIPLGMKPCVKGYAKFNEIRCATQWASNDFGTKTDQMTIEFRVFNSAPTWEEQYRNLAFVQAYMAFMKKKISKGIIPVLSNSSMDLIYWGAINNTVRRSVYDAFHNNLAFCASEFENFIKTIGLPFEEYESLIMENLEPQLTWGDRGYSPSPRETILSEELKALQAIY